MSIHDLWKAGLLASALLTAPACSSIPGLEKTSQADIQAPAAITVQTLRAARLDSCDGAACK